MRYHVALALASLLAACGAPRGDDARATADVDGGDAGAMRAQDQAKLADTAAIAPDRAAMKAHDVEGCVDCHLQDYQDVKHPVHADVKPTACGVCHAQGSWHPATVVHPFWALTGAHATPEPCAKCHQHEAGGTWKMHGTPTACVGCHAADRAKAKEHDRFSTACETCHTDVAWQPLVPDPKWPDEPAEPADAGVAPPDAGTHPATTNHPTTPTKHPPKTKPTPSGSAWPSPSTAPDVTTGGSRRRH